MSERWFLNMAKTEKTVVMTEDDMDRVLRRIAIEIIERNKGLEGIILLGIQRRGVFLASRLRKLFMEIENVKVPAGELDITLYRDDIPTLLEQPVVHSTSIPEDIAGKKLVLVDDVLYTGRTIRAALDAMMDLGRPDNVQLVILVDRGHRELPIQADYVGKVVPTSSSEMVEVRVNEIDGEDRVLITEEEKEGLA
jgi:pyrimidine operon attenuation protein/uracil phosphoribosyltransferase